MNPTSEVRVSVRRKNYQKARDSRRMEREMIWGVGFKLNRGDRTVDMDGRGKDRRSSGLLLFEREMRREDGIYR